MKIIPNKLITILLSIIVLLLSVAILNSCASTKGYYGRAEMTVAVVSSQKHNETIGKKNSWEIAYLCKVDDKVVGNNFKGYPSKCKVLPGRRMIEVEHYRQWKDSSTGLMVAGAMFGAIGGAIAGAAAAAGFVVGAMAYTGWGGIGAMSNMAGFWGTVGKIAKYGAIGVEGLYVTSTVVGAAGGLINKGWKGLGNSMKVLLGNFYLDENASFFKSIWQGVSRHTWETIQTGLGYDYTQFRNAFGSSIDRVDYLGGATFATNEYSKHSQGITLGSYCNMDVDGKVMDDFAYYVTHLNAMYMHEYGHTIDGRKRGFAYLFTVGIPSVISAKNSHNIGRLRPSHSYEPYERRANRLAAKYFSKNYGVNWFSPYPNSNSPWTIADYYPL